MSTDVDKLLLRVKNLKEYVIQAEIPDHFEMRGVIPYDMRISEGIGTFTVYALNLSEAQTKVNDYLNK